jgi:hypothetical protein
MNCGFGFRFFFAAFFLVATLRRAPFRFVVFFLFARRAGFRAVVRRFFVARRLVAFFLRFAPICTSEMHGERVTTSHCTPHKVQVSLRRTSFFPSENGWFPRENWGSGPVTPASFERRSV